MGKAIFSDDFKRDAVRQITARGYPVAEVSQRLGVSQHSLREWKKKFAAPSEKVVARPRRHGGTRHPKATAYFAKDAK
ncbi:hypothetical protein BMJ25_12850 [Sinorhizobium medicae]|nr:hypothetical protein BMJ25_12850 [Sinorhizobium medicae]